MKSIKFLLCLGVAAVAAHVSSAAAQLPLAEWPKSYSVEMEVEAGGMKNVMKLFCDGEKQRTEMNAGGMEMITIMRKDLKKIYSLMPAQKMVTESEYPDMPPPAAAPAGSEPVCEKIGTATINGISCTEYKVTAGGNATTWFLNSDNLPVRMVSSGNTTDWKNFQPGTPAAALFEIPAGYSKPGEAPAGDQESSANNADSSADSAPAAAPEKPAKKKKGLGGMLGR